MIKTIKKLHTTLFEIFRKSIFLCSQILKQVQNDNKTKDLITCHSEFISGSLIFERIFLYNRFVICAFFLLFIFQNSIAQQPNFSTLRYKKVVISKLPFTLDSFCMVPNTCTITNAYGKRISENGLEINYAKATIERINGAAISLSDTLHFLYRIYPFISSTSLAHKTKSFKKDSTGKFVSDVFVIDTNTSIWSKTDFSQLEYSGSMYRGISVGNNQNAALNSGFNIQLAGKITKDVEVKAAITDNNIPLQPDGNTAQLQQFDRIFIQVTKEPHTFIIGDYDIAQDASSYFLQFNKKLQGISYKTHSITADSVFKNNTHAAAALSRGQFNRQEIKPQEGIQGPYKLVGVNGETFIIVLAGTERVFLNGIPMQRGYNEDYVIDYNLGEITFTSKRFITADKRIVVEFQYSDKNYFRTALYAHHTFEWKKIKLHANYYSETDNKNQPLNITLDGTKRDVLINAGDNPNLAVVNGWSRVEQADATLVLYRKKDTTIQGVTYSPIFQWADYADTGLYQVQFSYLGNNKGNYVAAASSANGRTYAWVAPVAGIPQGSYEPVIQLIAPKKEQLISLGTEITVNKNSKIKTELALSTKDLNTFSTKDDGNNKGVGAMLHWKQYVPSKLKSQTGFTTEIQYEFAQKTFNPIQRYRAVEFERDWSTQQFSAVRKDEHIVRNILQYNWRTQGFVKSQISVYHKDSVYTGVEQQILSDVSFEKTKIISNSKFLYSKTALGTVAFIRPNIRLIQGFTKLKNLYTSILLDYEIKRSMPKDSIRLDTVSYRWENYTWSIFSSDSLKNKFGIDYTLRKEYTPTSDYFTQSQKAHQIVLRGDFAKNPAHQFSYNITYKHLENASSIQVNQLRDYYVAKIQNTEILGRGFIQASSTYEVGAGREQRQQYSYIKAPNGYGNYAWKDLNNNGTFELNEAFVSSFQYENQYIRVYSNTPEYLPVNYVRLYNATQIQPKALWFGAHGIKKFLTNFADLFTIDINRKIFLSTDLGSKVINPFLLNSADSVVVSQSASIRNVLYIMRDNPKFSADYEWNILAAKNLLSNGLEGRKQRLQQIQTRYSPTSSIQIRTKYANAIRENTSDYFAERRYQILSNDVDVRCTYLIKNFLRIEGSYTYWFKSNFTQNFGNQFSVSNRANIQLKYSHATKGIAELQCTLAQIAYNDTKAKNAQVELAMLNGEKTGLNVYVISRIERKLSDILQLTFYYEGRKNLAAGNKFIHTGNMEVRAMF